MAENQTHLTESVTPDVTSPLPFRAWAGDHSDDDGRAIDDFFEAAYAGPVDYEEPPTEKKEIKTTTRLVNRTVTLAPTLQLMILPPDVHRTTFVIWTDDADSITFAGDSGELSMAGLLSAANPLTLSGHTGPVWVQNVGASDATVNVAAVTE